MERKSLPGELSPEQKAELLRKAEALKIMVASGGWAIFKEIFEKSIDVESDLRNYSIDGKTDADIASDIRVTKRLHDRLVMIFRNVIELIEKGDNLFQIEEKKRNKVSVFTIRK